jgi:hypothetical protein
MSLLLADIQSLRFGDRTGANLVKADAEVAKNKVIKHTIENISVVPGINRVLFLRLGDADTLITVSVVSDACFLLDSIRESVRFSKLIPAARSLSR